MAKKRTSTQNDKHRAKLARLAKQATAINGEISTLLAAMEANEAQELKKVAAIPDPKAQAGLLDASMLEEFQQLLEKFSLSRTPKNLDSILLELLRLLFKIIWKLFILQGIEPPPIDPRLLDAGPAGS